MESYFAKNIYNSIKYKFKNNQKVSFGNFWIVNGK